MIECPFRLLSLFEDDRRLTFIGNAVGHAISHFTPMKDHEIEDSI